jgi:cell division GTPase FtsZ
VIWNCISYDAVPLKKIEMQSQFFIAPSIETVVTETSDIFSAGSPLISLDIADISSITKDASNVVLLEGYANGSCRISDSIEDAIVKICTVAKGFDLFSATAILVHLSYNEKEPILSADLSELSQFVDMFQADTSIIWGLSCDKNIMGDTVIARLIASNLKLKNINY